jgi:4-hydroxy-4-methyl-2-oxoglutarate aldolase
MAVTKKKSRKTTRRAASPLQGLVRRLRRQSTDTISDVLDVMGLSHQVLSAALRPLGAKARLAGPAFCVRGRALDGAAPPPAGAPFEVDRALTPGCVVVMATGGHASSAVIGGNVVAAYRTRGCVGLVVDGAVRDGAEIRALLPAFCTHVTPRRPAGRWAVAEFGQPISLPGQGGTPVIIHPGDLILGDEDGVVVIPRSIAGEVIEAAEKLARIDARVTVDIRRGRDREEALKAHDRFAHIRRIVPPA